MNGFSTSTAGTLVTMLQRSAVISLKTAIFSRCRRPTAAMTSGDSTVFSSPAMTMNRH
jgi:hypothetical protein